MPNCLAIGKISRSKSRLHCQCCSATYRIAQDSPHDIPLPLVDYEGILAKGFGVGVCGRYPPSWSVADPEVKNLSGSDNIVQSVHDFLHRRGVVVLDLSEG